MSDKKNTLNQPVDKNKGKLATRIIIISIIAGFVISLFIYLIYRNIKLDAARMFEIAKVKIDDFNKEKNFSSKEELSPEIINLLDKVIINYSNTAPGQRALYYKGYILYSVEKYDKAENALNLFIKKFKKNYLLPKAYYILSYCYSDSKKYDEAINTLKIFESKLNKSYYAPLSIYRIGNIYELKGDNENAKKYYKKVLADYSDSAEKDIAKKKLLLLENDIKL